MKRLYCSESYISTAAAFLSGKEVSDICGTNNRKLIETRFRVMRALSVFSTEPTRKEYITMSFDLCISTEYIKVLYKALVAAGWKPGCVISRPITASSFKAIPKGILTCSRLSKLLEAR